MTKISIYALKCWTTSIVIGLLWIALYSNLKPNGDIESPLFALIFFSGPLFAILYSYCLIGYHLFKTPQKFRMILMILSIGIWIVFSTFVFGLRFYNLFRLENLIIMTQVIGLVFGIWYYHLELKQSIKVDDDDILDMEM